MIDIYGHLTPEERLDKAAEIIAVGLLRLAAKMEKEREEAANPHTDSGEEKLLSA